MRVRVSFSNNTTDNKGRAKYATGDGAGKKAVLTGWGGSEARAIRRLWRRIPRERLLPGMSSLFPVGPSPKTVRKPSRLTVFTAYVIHTVSFETGIYRLTLAAIVVKFRKSSRLVSGFEFKPCIRLCAPRNVFCLQSRRRNSDETVLTPTIGHDRRIRDTLPQSLEENFPNCGPRVWGRI